MLIPQFSTRWMLAAVTMAAFFCLAIVVTVNGGPLARPLGMASVGTIASLFLALLVYGLLFLANWLIAMVLFPTAGSSMRGSPFASAAPPPQLITPPEDPE